jgi:hypothetical protein
MFRAVGKIQTQVDGLFEFEGRMTLNRHTVFADVDDLVQIEHCAFGFSGEGSIRRCLDLVSHTPATIG